MIERFLPWYDAEAEAQHDQRTEAIRQKSIAARVESEGAVDRMREGYRAYAERVRR